MSDDLPFYFKQLPALLITVILEFLFGLALHHCPRNILGIYRWDAFLPISKAGAVLASLGPCPINAGPGHTPWLWTCPETSPPSAVGTSETCFNQERNQNRPKMARGENCWGKRIWILTRHFLRKCPLTINRNGYSILGPLKKKKKKTSQGLKLDLRLMGCI